MGASRFLTGAHFSHLTRANSVSISTGAADALYPLTYVDNGVPHQPFKFSAAGSTRAIDADIDLLGGTGSFEGTNGNPPTGWTTSGTGSAVLDNTAPHGGTEALKLTNGVGQTIQAYYDFTARSGEAAQLDVWYKSDATAVAIARVQNRSTGKYLKSDGTWQTASQDLISSTTAAWTNFTRTFTVEAWSTSLLDEVTLRVTLLNNTASSTCRFDDTSVYPATDIASIHGHNWPASVTATLVSAANTDSTFSSPTTQATFTLGEPAFYALLSSPVYARYWRLNLADSIASTILLIGEYVLGQTTSLTTVPRHPGVASWTVTGRNEQVRITTLAGASRVYGLSDHPRRILRVPYMHTTAAAALQLQQELRDRSQRGRYPMVYVPYDGETTVVFGRVDSQNDANRTFDVITEEEVLVTEEPLPVTGL